MKTPGLNPVILMTVCGMAGACATPPDEDLSPEQEATDEDLSPEQASADGADSEEITAISPDPEATENGGYVEMPSSETFDAQGAATAADPGPVLSVVVNVGGGTWNYGKSLSHCYSHYVHPTKRHSATAIRGSTERKVYANRGIWANADITGVSFRTCYAYWNTY